MKPVDAEGLPADTVAQGDPRRREGPFRVTRLIARAGPGACAAALWLLAPTAGAWAQGSPPAAPGKAPPTLTAEQWRADLRFMVRELETRHADLHHTVSRDDFAAAVADLDRRIPTLQRNGIVVGMMRIAAMVGDGHTRLDPRKDEAFAFRSLPLKLYLFEDGLYIRAARPDQAKLVGARIEAIGGVPVAEALRRVSELVSRDNEMGVRRFAPLYLNMPDILQALGLAEGREAATFTLRRGTDRWSATVAASEVEPLWPPDTDISLITPEGWIDARRSPAPMWLAAPLEYHRLIETPDRGSLYVQLNMVAGIKGQSLDQFGALIRKRAEALNPRVVVFDVRLNQGGNGALRNGLVRELVKTEDADTRLVVLTWRGSFSATQFILDDLDRLTDAVFIGEPASSRPSSFGDSYRSKMPNSGINVRTSILWWQAEQNRDPWTWVDVSAPLSFADYVAGSDPALDAALAYSPPPPLDRKLAAAFDHAGIAGINEALKAYAADPANRYSHIGRKIAAAAEALQGAGDKDAALAAAQFAAERFPRYAGGPAVLAFVAESRGDRNLARSAAMRTLSIDRNNRFAQSVIQRLDAPQP